MAAKQRDIQRILTLVKVLDEQSDGYQGASGLVLKGRSDSSSIWVVDPKDDRTLAELSWQDGGYEVVISW